MPRAEIASSWKVFFNIFREACIDRQIYLNQQQVQTSISQMEPKKTIKIGSNLHFRIDQYSQNKQWTVYLTVLTLDQLSYILQINSEKSQLLPTCISTGNTCAVTQIQQKITKQNKKQVLEKFVVCQPDQINDIVQSFMIVNFTLDAYIGFDMDLVGFAVQNNSKNKPFGRISKFQQVFNTCKTQAKQIWNKFNSQYCKSINQKNNKQKYNKTYQVIPFLQFQIQTLVQPVLNNNKTRSIQQYSSFHCYYPILFNIKQETDEKVLANKVSLFIKQKLSTKQFDYKICKVPILNCLRANPKKIFNPHAFAKYTNKDKFQIIMAKGMYQYFHYGDQNFHDNGWGCAYRSLQTLISWLKIQSYLTQPMQNMLTIIQIQQKLDQFDRSRKLKGSNTWIGATQISWLIPKITTPSINCKILHISDGKQIMQKCEQFKNHFLGSGCPIMYGGGQYAYTIVGMHYNWKLGECEFLILDPHYTGEDDYGRVLEKKGLAWRKPEEMFKKGVFYNFCMPIIKGMH